MNTWVLYCLTYGLQGIIVPVFMHFFNIPKETATRNALFSRHLKLSKPRKPLMPGERKMWKEDFYDESKIICKAYLRKVQNHQKKRQYQSNLRESKAQTAPGIIQQTVIPVKKYICAAGHWWLREGLPYYRYQCYLQYIWPGLFTMILLKTEKCVKQSIWKVGSLSGWIWKSISHLGKCQRAPIKKRPELIV